MTAKGSARRCAIYARVSTAEQSTSMQLDELRAMAEQRGWRLVGEYVDAGVSGSKDRRPELDRLKADVARGKIDVVAVWKFDRFARSVHHLVVALGEFQAVGVDFVSLRDQVDTTTPVGKLSFHILAALAEFERDLIRERTRAGVAAARKRGAQIGRPVCKMDLTAAAQMKADGVPMEDIARAAGVSVSTLARRLRELRSGIEVTA